MLAGIGETTRLLSELWDRYLAQAIGPRQNALLEPVIDRRLDRAGDDLGRTDTAVRTGLSDRYAGADVSVEGAVRRRHQTVHAP